MAIRVVLVSCVKSKRAAASAAQDLYTSDLFASMRNYAQINADKWFILSAEHGVLKPDEIVRPYERTLNRLPKRERLEWAESVQRKLLELLPPGALITIFAGERYRENLVPFLRQHGFPVSIPMAGLKFGFQLRWLKERNRSEAIV